MICYEEWNASKETAYVCAQKAYRRYMCSRNSPKSIWERKYKP